MAGTVDGTAADRDIVALGTAVAVVEAGMDTAALRIAAADVGGVAASSSVQVPKR